MAEILVKCIDCNNWYILNDFKAVWMEKGKILDVCPECIFIRQKNKELTDCKTGDLCKP